MKTGIVAGFAAVLAAGLACAQGSEGNGERRGGPPKHGGGPEKKDFFTHMLRSSDTDKNGSISFGEFAAGARVAELPEDAQRRLFERFDKNKDGEIRRDEIPKPQGWGRGGPDRGGKSRGPHDPDGDGRVSLEEFRKNPRVAEMEPARQKELFDKLDRNDDGFLDPKDHTGRRPGRDGEGRGPWGPANPPRMVEELDTNKDGSVSFEEFRKSSRIKDLDEDRAEEMFKHLDRNKNGKLAPDDFRMERRAPGIGPRGPGKGPDGAGRGRDGRGPRAPMKPAA